MADEPWLMFIAIAVAGPGTLYVGMRRDQVSDFWFAAVGVSFIAMGVGYTEQIIVLYWIGAGALILSTTVATVQVRRKQKATKSTGLGSGEPS